MTHASSAEVDCVIVGAGYAGLTAALRLTQATPPASVLVLEARPRARGRPRPDRHAQRRHLARPRRHLVRDRTGLLVQAGGRDERAHLSDLD